MQNDRIRQGYSPVFIQDLEREDYLHMIKDAQDGKPDELVDRVITIHLEVMQTFKMWEME